MIKNFVLNLSKFHKTHFILFILFIFITISFAEEKETRGNINGYFQLGTFGLISKYDETKYSYLEINRSELSFSYKLFSSIDSFISIGNDEMSKEGYITVKDIKIDFNFSPLFILTLGIYKAPFSYELLTPETKLDFIDRSESTKIFGPKRTIGTQIAGKAGILRYAFKISHDYIGYYNDSNYANGRIIFDFTDWFHLGISEYYGIFYDYKKLYMITSAGELVFDFSPFVFKAEYLHGYPDSNLYRISSKGIYGYSEGWYAQLGYELFDKIELLLKWDHLWSRDRRLDITDNYTFGVNYYINKNSKLQFNYLNERYIKHKFMLLFQSMLDIKF